MYTYYSLIGWAPRLMSAILELKQATTGGLITGVCSAIDRLMCNWNHVQSREKMADCFHDLPGTEVLKIWNKLGDRMIKQMLNSVIAKYRDLSASSRSIIRLNRSPLTNHCIFLNLIQ